MKVQYSVLLCQESVGSYFIFTIHFTIILPSPSSLKCPLLEFPTTILYAPLISPMRAMCPTHVILHDLVTAITTLHQERNFTD